MQRVHEVLIVGHTLVVAHVKAAVMAQDARADIGLSTRFKLRHPSGISQERPSEARGVDTFLGDGRGGVGRLHASGAYDGHVDVPAQLGHVSEVAVLGHVDRRVGPVPGVIGTVIAVEHVAACVGQVARSLDGLGHVAAGLYELLARKCALTQTLRLGLNAVADGHGKVVAAGTLDGTYDLGRETIPVLQAAAVLIGALVHVFQGELIEEIALMDGVHLDAVDTCLLEQARRLGERLDDLVDLRLGDLTRRHLVRPAVGRGARSGADALEVHDGLGSGAQDGVRVERLHERTDGERSAEACRELHEQLGAGCMEHRHPRR